MGDTHSSPDEEAHLARWRAHDVFGDSAPADPGRYVYHYTSLASAAAIALTGSLSLNRLGNMNDPSESHVPELHVKTSGSPPSPVDPKERGDFVDELAKSRRSVRLVCFGSDGPPADALPGSARLLSKRGFGQTSMWAHYGDNHQGVVIAFDRVKLESQARSTFGDKANCRSVKYEGGFSSARFDAQVAGFDSGAGPDAHFNEKVIKSMFLKSDHWIQEHEYRIVVTDWHETECNLPITGTITGIALGFDFKDYRLSTAVAVAKSLVDIESLAILGLNNLILQPFPVIDHEGRPKWWSARDRHNGTMFKTSS